MRYYFLIKQRRNLSIFKICFVIWENSSKVKCFKLFREERMAYMNSNILDSNLYLFLKKKFYHDIQKYKKFMVQINVKKF